MFMVAARRLGELSRADHDGLLPAVTELRDVALEIAVVVAAQAQAEGLATAEPDALTRESIAASMWQAQYV
jgi:malate dehydrogenase (oxaloacetate-decarboxylating)